MQTGDKKCAGFEKVFEAAKRAVKSGYVVTVSVVAHSKNVEEIPELYNIVKNEIKPRVFRIMTIDQIGRTSFDSEYLLSKSQITRIVEFLKWGYEKRNKFCFEWF